jgi:hypothetical protein
MVIKYVLFLSKVGPRVNSFITNQHCMGSVKQGLTVFLLKTPDSTYFFTNYVLSFVKIK